MCDSEIVLKFTVGSSLSKLSNCTVFFLKKKRFYYRFFVDSFNWQAFPSAIACYVHVRPFHCFQSHTKHAFRGNADEQAMTSPRRNSSKHSISTPTHNHDVQDHAHRVKRKKKRHRSGQPTQNGDVITKRQSSITPGVSFSKLVFYCLVRNATP